MNILRLPDINISQVIYTAKITGKIDINKTGLKRVHWSGGYIRINKRKLNIHVSRNIVFCIENIFDVIARLIKRLEKKGVFTYDNNQKSWEIAPSNINCNTTIEVDLRSKLMLNLQAHFSGEIEKLINEEGIFHGGVDFDIGNLDLRNYQFKFSEGETKLFTITIIHTGYVNIITNKFSILNRIADILEATKNQENPEQNQENPE